jgi:hypothetical protein
MNAVLSGPCLIGSQIGLRHSYQVKPGCQIGRMTLLQTLADKLARL